MKTFKLSCQITVGAWTKVQANSEEEAIHIAEDRGVALGGIGTGVDGDEVWLIEEADGAPTNISVDD